MEVVERPKIPPRKPHKKVIPHTEEPYDGKAGPGEDPRAVGDISPYLLRGGREARFVSLLCWGGRFGTWEVWRGGGVLEVSGEDHVSLHGTRDVEKEEGEDGEGLGSRGDGAPAHVLEASVSECRW